ncbi:hypothetical protein M885DRAFT_552964 [Pelagophyceae sp. CCMP2097]|nr:hypothetical protein M885DRAFT_552964 [Pelagophyceae sp. CCMP2097]
MRLLASNGHDVASPDAAPAAAPRWPRVEAPAPRGPSRSLRRCAAAAAALAALCGGSLAMYFFRSRVAVLCVALQRVPRAQGAAAYVALVTAWLLLLLPTSVLEVAGGYIFGFWTAAGCSTTGKVLGSLISFAIGRQFKDRVRQWRIFDADGDRSRNHRRGGGDDDDPPASAPTGGGYVAGLALSMRTQPFATCLALRLAYVPEVVQNYVPALLDAPPERFFAATALGSSLYAALWAKIGSELQDAQGAQDPYSPERITFLVLGLASLGAVMGLVHYNTRRLVEGLAVPGADDTPAPPSPANGAGDDESPLAPPTLPAKAAHMGQRPLGIGIPDDNPASARLLLV